MRTLEEQHAAQRCSNPWAAHRSATQHLGGWLQLQELVHSQGDGACPLAGRMCREQVRYNPKLRHGYCRIMEHVMQRRRWLEFLSYSQHKEAEACLPWREP